MRRLFSALFALVFVAAGFAQPGPGGNFPGGRTPGQIPGQNNTDAMTRAYMRSLEMDGAITMRFANALNGEAIPGADVAVDGGGSFVTDAQGIIVMPPMRDGNYRLVFSKTGFITTQIDFPVQVGTVVFNWFSVSPGLEARAWRFVLDWGERPADLDLHLEKRGDYHISYLNMHTSADGSARLDRDDTSSYGPETITINRAEPGAVYSLYVVDYTNRSRGAASGELGRSGATVRVYSDNRLTNTFSVPQGNGTRWDVFRIEQGRVVPVNTLSAGR